MADRLQPQPKENEHSQESVAPHSCNACRSLFNNDVELMQHARAAGHLPFACKCGQFFSRKDTLQRHVKSMAPGEGLERCPLCPASFKRPDNVSQHLRTYHRVHPQSLGQFKKPRARNPRAASLARGPVGTIHSGGPYGLPLVEGSFNVLPALFEGP